MQIQPAKKLEKLVLKIYIIYSHLFSQQEKMPKQMFSIYVKVSLLVSFWFLVMES